MTIAFQKDEQSTLDVTMPIIGTAPSRPRQVPAPKKNVSLSVCNLLSKGWEVSILGLLAFLQQKYSLPIYVVGILSTVFIVSQISVSFFAGRIAHAIQDRNVIFLSIAASGISWLTLFMASQTPALYLAYALAGIASGLFEPIGNSLIARDAAANNRGAAIGNFAAFGDMGRIAVVALATALAGAFGLNNAFRVLFLSAIAAFFLATMFISKPEASDFPYPEDAHSRLSDLLKNCGFRYATAAGITDSFSSASLYIFIPFLLNAKGIALANTLYFNVVFFGGYMLGRLILGRLADKYGASGTLIVSEILMSSLILTLTLASALNNIVVLLFVLGIFTRGTSPVIRAMVADSVEATGRFHEAFSVYSFASRGSTAVCRPIYGYLAAYSGITSVFYIASAVSMLTLAPAMRYRVTRKNRLLSGQSR